MQSASNFAAINTSPITVTISATADTVRDKAPPIAVASVVNRVASWAGASRSTRARSVPVKCANMRICRSRMTSNTIC